MDPKSKEYQKLQKFWYAKLEKQGFYDIEHADEFRTMKSWAARPGNVMKQPARVASEQEYYRVAGHFLNEYEFNTKVDRMVWELHAEGKSIREIAVILKKQGIRLKKSAVGLITARIAKEMTNKCR